MVKASYAVRKETGRGRIHSEEESHSRSPWQRDRDRVLHSTGFRNLQYKTQVFLNHEGDFFRTRLTHSLEVSQIARSMACSLKLDQDVTEVISLAHDLGHTPFGHAGEDALQEALALWGGFNHNVQSLRLVTELERRYHAFDGLNLTWETLEGLAKHNGPVKKPHSWLEDLDRDFPLELKKFCSLEGQIAAICDDIAYHGHDLDDGLRAGLLDFESLEEVPLLAKALKIVRDLDWSDFDSEERPQRLRHELVRRVINALVHDVVQQTRENLAEIKPETIKDVRDCGKALVAFSSEMAQRNKEIRKFLYGHMYHHWKVLRMTRKAKEAVKDIFAILKEDPKLLPPPWQKKALYFKSEGASGAMCRLIGDYIAGMTDRFAMEEHRRLTDLSILG